MQNLYRQTIIVYIISKSRMGIIEENQENLYFIKGSKLIIFTSVMPRTKKSTSKIIKRMKSLRKRQQMSKGLTCWRLHPEY